MWGAGQLLATYSVDTDPAQNVPGILNFFFTDMVGTRTRGPHGQVFVRGVAGRVMTDYAGNVMEACHSLPYGNGASGSRIDRRRSRRPPVAFSSRKCHIAPTSKCKVNSGPAQDCAASPTEHLFTNKERDAETGNDYFGARYYASSMGRFMSPDWSAKVEPVPYAKLDDPQSLNLYEYVGNNPMVRVDADGHCPICIAWAGEVAVGAGVGAGIGAGVEVVSDLISGQKVTWAGVKGAAAEGAITGAITAGTEGMSLVSKSAYGAAAGVIGGVVGRDLKGEKNTAGKVLTDAVTGAAGPTLTKAGKGLGAWLHGSTSSEIEGKIGAKMGARHLKSLGRQAAAAVKAENAGAKAVEVTSGAAISTAKNLAQSQNEQKH